MQHDIVKKWKHSGLNCCVIKVSDVLGENYMSGLRFFDMGSASSWYCGYVGIDKTNDLFEVNYHDDKIEEKIDVHGGVTFSDFGNQYLDKKLWWLGFDCAHYGDEWEWNEEEVIKETERFAELISKFAKKTETKAKTTTKTKTNVKTKTVVKKKGKK